MHCDKLALMLSATTGPTPLSFCKSIFDAKFIKTGVCDILRNSENDTHKMYYKSNIISNVNKRMIDTIAPTIWQSLIQYQKFDK